MNDHHRSDHTSISLNAIRVLSANNNLQQPQLEDPSKAFLPARPTAAQVASRLAQSSVAESRDARPSNLHRESMTGPYKTMPCLKTVTRPHQQFPPAARFAQVDGLCPADQSHHYRRHRPASQFARRPDSPRSHGYHTCHIRLQQVLVSPKTACLLAT